MFNAAAAHDGESRFLGFYRVLEYFYSRAVAKEVERARVDPSFDTDSLIALARAQRELEQLKQLMGFTLTASEKRAVIRTATRQKLVSHPSMERVAEALYAYRNSLVHAKEAEIAKTRIPDPLLPRTRQPLWGRFVEDLARAAIKRLA